MATALPSSTIKKASSGKDEVLLSAETAFSIEVVETKTTADVQVDEIPIAGTQDTEKDELTDLPNVPGCLGCLTDGIHKLTSKSQSRKPGDTNLAVGLSCFCYLYPTITIFSLTAWSVRSSLFYEACWYVVVSTNSFLSDYVFLGTESIWHPVDRWTGSNIYVHCGCPKC